MIVTGIQYRKMLQDVGPQLFYVYERIAQIVPPNGVVSWRYIVEWKRKDGRYHTYYVRPYWLRKLKAMSLYVGGSHYQFPKGMLS